MRSGSFVVGSLCVALATSVSSGQTPDMEPPLARPEMTLMVQPSGVKISGAISSAANEALLRETAAQLFPGQTAVAELQIRAALPPGWALATDLTLKALAETRSATAVIRPYAVTVRGFSADAGRWETAAARTRDYLPEGWRFRFQVEETDPGGSIERQCIELFRTALRGRKIAFERASAELGTASMPLLDELIQIAVDCPAAMIEITGHADNSGTEAGNLALSQQRADAVAGYLVASGIAERRLTATGVGSSRPLVADNTPQGRRLNRRIDIELTFP